MHQATPFAPAPPRRGSGWRSVIFLTALLAGPAAGPAMVFDVPAGNAIRTLKRTAQQAGLEIMFPAGLVQGVRTNAIKGDLSPQEAFDRLTAGTILSVVRDKETGALIVTRLPDPTRKAAPGPPPPASSTKEQVLTLDTFLVSTTVGTYKETSTAAGTKMPMNMRDFGGTIQVLNASFIADRQAQSLEDLYPYVVGMTRESQAAAGFTLRGFTNNATNTLLNNIQYDGLAGGAARFDSPTTANVDRVEIIKGPNSVLYGAMSPGGIINIVSKSPLAIAAHSLTLSVGGFAGQDDAYSAGERLGYTATLDSSGPLDEKSHWLYRFIASYEAAANWRQFDWGRSYYFYPALTYRLNQDTEVTLKVELIRQHRFVISDQQLVAPFHLIALVPRDHSIVYQDPQNDEYDRNEVYSLSAIHHFSRWTAKYNVRTVQHVDGRKILENKSVNSILPVEDSTITQRYRDTWNRRRYAYHDFNLYGDVGPEDFQHTLLFGANYGYETENFTRWLFANVTGPAINVYHPLHNLTTYPGYLPETGPTQIALQKYYNHGFYFSDQIKLGRNWRASAGIHTDTYQSRYRDSALLPNGLAVNPGTRNNSRSTVSALGLVYQPREYISIYTSYTEGFKPSIAQAVDGSGVGRPPEKADQEEIGCKMDFLSGALGVLFCYYDITRQNVTEAPAGLLDPNGVQVFRTLSQRNQGIELSLNYQPRPYIQMQFGYTHMDARVSETPQIQLMNARLANAPAHGGNLWTRYNMPEGPLRGIGVGLGLVYTGNRPGLVSNIPENQLLIPANFRMDLAFYYKQKHYDFGLNITNVLDKSYIASADNELDVVPGAPRKVTLSVHTTF